MVEWRCVLCPEHASPPLIPFQLRSNDDFRRVIDSSATLSHSTPIQDKYTSVDVEKYREEINTEAKEKTLWLPAQSPASTRSNTETSTQTRTRRRGDGALGAVGAGAGAATATATATAAATADTAAATDAPYAHGNEDYFEKLGRENEARSAELPPSQGGRYTGFGNTPASSSQTTSNNLPSIDDLRDNPVQAVSKGWGLFSSALGGAASALKSTVDERLADPNLERDLQGYKDNFGSYLNQGLNKVGEYGNAANEWTRRELERQLGNEGSNGDASRVNKNT